MQLKVRILQKLQKIPDLEDLNPSLLTIDQQAVLNNHYFQLLNAINQETWTPNDIQQKNTDIGQNIGFSSNVINDELLSKTEFLNEESSLKNPMVFVKMVAPPKTVQISDQNLGDWVLEATSDMVANLLPQYTSLNRPGSKSALVYGQMNKPPGDRIALFGLADAEYLRDTKGQDMLFFIDNIFRFTQACSEVSALLGRIPSDVGYQPTLATDMGAMWGVDMKQASFFNDAKVNDMNFDTEEKRILLVHEIGSASTDFTSEQLINHQYGDWLHIWNQSAKQQDSYLRTIDNTQQFAFNKISIPCDANTVSQMLFPTIISSNFGSAGTPIWSPSTTLLSTTSSLAPMSADVWLRTPKYLIWVVQPDAVQKRG